jgi:methylmalonyl-CoA mutase C-terminal domain/subunit
VTRVLLAKTGLDGHWRGPLLVAQTLRDAGFEVVMLGMARADEIVAAAVDEDVELVGLNVGGRVEVVERVVDALAEAAPGVPVIAGGVIPPWARERLEARGVEVFPPGSSLAGIVEAAQRLTRVTTSTEGGR